MYPPDYEPKETGYEECERCDGTGFIADPPEDAPDDNCPDCHRGVVVSECLPEHTRTGLLCALWSGERI